MTEDNLETISEIFMKADPDGRLACGINKHRQNAQPEVAWGQCDASCYRRPKPAILIGTTPPNAMTRGCLCAAVMTAF
jgi:hypothetical protein